MLTPVEPAQFNPPVNSVPFRGVPNASTLRFQGGGLYIQGSAQVEMTSCTIHDNTADVSGHQAEFNAPLN